MSSFVHSTAEGFSVTVNECGRRVALDHDMQIELNDVGGADVYVERQDGRLTCAAKLPESKEPIRWVFEVLNSTVRSTRAPTPLQDGRSLQTVISDYRIALNGKL